MRNRTRVIAATAAATAALAAGGIGAAVASTTGATPAAHAKVVPGSEKRAAERALKISLSKAGGKPVGSKTARSKAAGSKAAKLKAARFKTAGAENTGRPGNDALAAAVARELHVTTARVNAALRPLFAAGQADPSSPAFTAGARALGVSTQHLAIALAHAKESLAGGR